MPFVHRNNLFLLAMSLLLPFCIWGQAPRPDAVEAAEEELMARLDSGCAEARQFVQNYAGAPSSDPPEFRRAMGELLQGIYVSNRQMDNLSADPRAHFRAALAMAVQHRWPLMAARAEIGLARFANGPDSTVIYLQRAESWLAIQPWPRYEAVVDNAYAIVFGSNSNMTEAFAHFRDGLRILDQLPPSKPVWRTKARLLHNQGLFQDQDQQFEAALRSLEESLEIRLRNGFHMDIPINQSVLANIYFKLGRMDRALELIEQAERNSRNSCLAAYRTSILISYANFTKEKGDYRKALEIARDVEQLGRKLGNLVLVHDALKIQRQSLELLGEYREANRMMNVEHALKDSLYNEQMATKVTELDAVKKQKEQEKELTELNIDLQKRRFAMLLLGVVTVLVCLLLATAVLYAVNRRKANRKLLQQAVELANANSAKERLFSILAHDLRSPLQSLSTLIAQQNRLREAGLDVDEHLRYLQQQVVDTGSLLDNLLLWASRDKQQLVAKTAPVDLGAVIEEECRMQSEEARLIGCTLVFRPEIRPTVSADANMIRFVVRNLVSNALKFSPENQPVTVTIDRSEGRVRVSVRDEGPGFSPAVISALRSPLETFDKKGNLQHGLGLALSRSFLEQHRSELQIESRPERGSTVWFDLPEITGP